jgi:preprotein translocase subunit SecF
MEIFNPNSNYDFLGPRRITVSISLLLVLAAIVTLAVKGLNYGLDFTGGTLIVTQYEQSPDLAEVRANLTAAGFPSAVVQELGKGSGEVQIRVAPHEKDPAAAEGETATKALADEVQKALSKGGQKVTIKRSDFVGPQVGQELRSDGLLAVTVVALGIMFYVWLRFEWRFGVAAIVAEIHDTLLTLGFLSLIGMEFDLTVLAAVLSVVGYSVNDKVVVFDRVRELFRSGRKMDSHEVLDRAINTTLSRTIMTALLTLLAVSSLYIIGRSSAPVIAGFGLTMMVGIVIGTLSSIFFASPILLWLGVSKRDLMPKARDAGELKRRP